MERQISSEEWVAIQPDPFEAGETRTSYLRFNVAWNEHQHKIAIVCHEEKNRTIRRTLNAKAPLKLWDSKQRKGEKENGDSKQEPCEDKTKDGWTALLSIHELQYAHEQMCLVKPELANYPPSLPFDPRGIWSWIYSVEIPDDFEPEVVRYLSTASDVCGKKLLTDTLFNSEVGIDGYVENYGKLRQDVYEADVTTWKEKLKKSHKEHSSVRKMVAMMELYEKEDGILNELALAQAELFNLYLQPYLDLRELAFNNLLNLQERLSDECMSEQGREKCTMDYSEWQEQYVDSIEAVNRLRIKYFEDCLSTTKGKLISFYTLSCVLQTT